MASMSLQAAYDQARQWLESNDLNRAIGLAQYILEQYPDNLDAYRILGEAYLANRQLDRAQEAFERVLRSDPENIPAHVGLGITFERQGQLGHAIPEFEQALEIKPDMPELRSQLLRLYTEAWGSDHAHLRLSRAGLARLYAKGHMLPQAINEFRQVINAEPTRFDAMVALAEALWRDGQEDAAVALCREILQKQPKSLKANLILGYLEMAAGEPEGEAAWKAAQQMDPYQVVARALFDTLPPETGEEPAIEEWDETMWRQRRAEEQPERIAATRPMEAITPVGTFVGYDGGSQSIPAPPPARPTALADSDDFLANLLAINTPPPPPPVETAEEDLDLDPAMMPFSLDDLNDEPSAYRPAESPVGEPLATPLAQEDEAEMTPFSLADLGLSDAEIAGLESLTESSEAIPETPIAEPDEPEMMPFSLADLGLSDEEIAGLGGAADGPTIPDIDTASPELAESDEPTLKPFSLDSLGLSDEELAGLDSLDMGDLPDRSISDRSTQPLSAEQWSDEDIDTSDLPVDLQPFSLDELDLNTGDTPNIGGLGSSLQPFSFDEPPQRPRVSGFVADESYDTPDDVESTPETGGFSWQEPKQKPQPGFLKSLREEPDAEEGSIFAKLKQRHTQEERVQPPPPPPPPIGEEEHLGLFSMDNISLRDDDSSASEAPPEAIAPTPEPARAAPLEVDDLQEAVDAGLVQPFSLADLGLSEEEIAAFGLSDAVAATGEPAVPSPEPKADATERNSSFFLDDLEPVTPELGELPPEPIAQADEPTLETDDNFPVTDELQPFSLTDLGLSDEEIAALGLDTSNDSDMSVGSELGITEEDLEGLGLDNLNWNQPPASMPAPVSIPAETPMQATTGDLLVDRLLALGREQGYVDISDIIAAFDDPEAEAERIEEIGQRLHEARIEIRDGDEIIDMEADYSDEEPDASADQVPAQTDLSAPAEDEPTMTPFSLADLGLSDDEIASLGLADTLSPATAEPESMPPAENEPEMTPFSLADLGLSDEEIASLGLADTPAAEPPAPALEAPPEPALPAFDAQPTPPADEEPNMKPFSLADLGLSDEEIALLGLADTPTTGSPALEAPPASVAPVFDAELDSPEPVPALDEQAASPIDEEPVMTPFSLADLGLSEEEIAALGLGQTSDVAAEQSEQSAPEPEPSISAVEPEPTPTADEEPVMTPFSLADLGLSEEEIAALGMSQAGSDTPETIAPVLEEPAFDEPTNLPESALELPEIEEPSAEPETIAPVLEEPAFDEPTNLPEPTEPVQELPNVAASAPAPTRRRDDPPAASGHAALDTYVRRLEEAPENHMLRLSVARAGAQLGMADFAVQQYRFLIKHNALLEQIADDLQDLLADADDRQLLRRLHRTLGDVYTKQNRIAEAMDEYTWTPAGS